MPTFDQQVQLIAAKIRGAYLEMSSDIEFLLVDITCICLMRDERERNYIKEILVSSNMLSKKIDFTASALKVYNKEYYKIAEPHLIKFKQFKEMRNKLSHTRIIGDRDEIDLRTLWFVTFKDGELKETPFNVFDTYEALKEYASAIEQLGNALIPRIYQERYLTRYSNTLSFPSNRIKSHWHRLQPGTIQ